MENVILLTIDCLRYDRCGFNGHHQNTTPKLDSISRESVVFDQAYATGPYTTESFPGIIAGQHSYNGSYYGENPAWKALRAEDDTVASQLQENGYETVATLSNPHLTEARNFDLGFDEFENLRTGGHDKADNDEKEGLLVSRIYQFRERMRAHSSLVNLYTLPFILHRYKQSTSGWPTISGKSVIERFMSQLDSAAEKPFFGWAHLMDLHAPIHPERVRKGSLAPNISDFRHYSWDAARASRIHEPRYNTLYDSALRYVDEQIASLIEHLKERSLWEETILIVTGDHGEVLWDREEIYGHPRHHLYDELLHVPLLVRVPRQEHRRIGLPFSLAWLHELISEAIEVDDGDFPSQSNTTWLNEAIEPPEYILSDTLDDSGHTVAIRDTEKKVICNKHNGVDTDYDTKHEYMNEPVQFEYFSDPGERHKKDPDEELLYESEDILTQPDALPTVGEGFSGQMEQRLQDLGYKM